MVARASRPTRRPQLIGTVQASTALEVPGRTIRRWVKDQGLGQMVAGRRLLSPADVRALRTLRDHA
jgi:hypothetical protein